MIVTFHWEIKVYIVYSVDNLHTDLNKNGFNK